MAHLAALRDVDFAVFPVVPLVAVTHVVVDVVLARRVVHAPTPGALINVHLAVLQSANSIG